MNYGNERLVEILLRMENSTTKRTDESLINFIKNIKDKRFTNGRKEVIKEKRNEINDRDSSGKTSIFYVTRKDVMYYLFLLGANPNHQDNVWINPLDKAINMNLENRTRNLISLGAKPTDIEIYYSKEKHIYENLILYDDFYINVIKEIVSNKPSFELENQLIPSFAIRLHDDPISIYHCLGGGFDFWCQYNSQVLPLKILIVHYIHKTRESNNDEDRNRKINIPLNFPQKLLEVGTLDQLLDKSPNKIDNKKRKA